MIEISYSDFGHAEFASAIRKIDSFTGLPAKTAYKIGRVCKAIQTEHQRLVHEASKIAKKYAKITDKGLIETKGRDIVFKSPEDEAKYNADMIPFMQSTLALKIHKIPIEDLDGVQLSPSEITAIDKILELDGNRLKLVETQKGDPHGSEEKSDQEAEEEVIPPTSA